MTRTRLAAAAFVMAVLFSGHGCAAGAPSSTPSPSLRSGTAPPSATAPAFAPTATSALTPAPPALSEIKECGAIPDFIPRLSRATVLRVIDGDTIVLADGQRVRYIGIDTPELGPLEEYYAREATSANRQLVDGKEVSLEKDTSETDRFGRLLRYVYVDSTFINAELVRQGYAQAVAYPPDTKYQKCLEALEREAREAGRGIWGAPLATPSPPQGIVIISYIFYDGLVPRVESDEYVVVTNRGSIPQDMSGWLISAGDTGQKFVFPAGFVLQPGESCKIYTNEYHPQDCGGLSFGIGWPIWNNRGDCGYLYDADGILVNTYCY